MVAGGRGFTQVVKGERGGRDVLAGTGGGGGGQVMRVLQCYELLSNCTWRGLVVM